MRSASTGICTPIFMGSRGGNVESNIPPRPNVVWEAPGRFAPRRQFRVIILQKFGTIAVGSAAIPIWLWFYTGSSDKAAWTSPLIVTMFFVFACAVFILGLFQYRSDAQLAYPIVLGTGIRVLSPKFIGRRMILEVPWSKVTAVRADLSPVPERVSQKIGEAFDLRLELKRSNGEPILRLYSGLNKRSGVDHRLLAETLLSTWRAAQKANDS